MAEGRARAISFGAASFWLVVRLTARATPATAGFGAASFWLVVRPNSQRSHGSRGFGAASFWLVVRLAQLQAVEHGVLEQRRFGW